MPLLLLSRPKKWVTLLGVTLAISCALYIGFALINKFPIAKNIPVEGFVELFIAIGLIFLFKLVQKRQSYKKPSHFD